MFREVEQWTQIISFNKRPSLFKVRIAWLSIQYEMEESRMTCVKPSRLWKILAHIIWVKTITTLHPSVSRNFLMSKFGILYKSPLSGRAGKWW